MQKSLSLSSQNTNQKLSDANRVQIRQRPFLKPVIQSKLTINKPGDKYEQEADAMADSVMRMSSHEAVKPVTGLIGSSLQRKCSHCEEEEKRRKPVMRKTESGYGGMQVSSSFASSLNASKGSGAPISQGTRSFMENAFSTDFSAVRVHTGGQASQMSKGINAKAFTHGNDIYFDEGQYDPGSGEGKSLLAHELTHTVQQDGMSKMLQKSCSDGLCETCAGGMQDLWVSVFFRVRATARTMANLRRKINDAKALLRNCCINLKFDFNWNLVRGATSMDAFTPATATDRWRYTADETALGTGTTFSGARGIPMLVVDDVPLSGGGVTVSSVFDPHYTGRNYFIIALNQTNLATSSIAHELSHVTGINHNEPGNASLDNGTGNVVSERYCNNVRALP
jgi:Domain of unknown function (DUF4157)